MLCCAVLCRLVPVCVVLYCVVWCGVVLTLTVVSNHRMDRVKLCCVVLFCIVLCGRVWCCGVLHSIVLVCVVLSCDVSKSIV